MEGCCVGTELKRHWMCSLFHFVLFFANSFLIFFGCSYYDGGSVLFVCFVLFYFFLKKQHRKTYQVYFS